MIRASIVFAIFPYIFYLSSICSYLMRRAGCSSCMARWTRMSILCSTQHNSSTSWSNMGNHINFRFLSSLAWSSDSEPPPYSCVGTKSCPGVPWWTSQSPTPRLQRALLDLPPLLPQEKPVRSDHCQMGKLNLNKQDCNQPLSSMQSSALWDLWSPKNAKQSVSQSARKVKYLFTFQLLTCLQFVDKRSTLCCETFTSK